MAHYVICTKCGERFDRDSVQAVKTGARRYAHATCDPNNTDFVPLAQKPEEDPDMIKLKNYINQLYGKNANWALINKQIKNYIKDKGYSLSGILKSLIYFYDVQGHDISGSNGGIGIVDYTYQAAYNYYYNLFIAQNQNISKDINNITSKTKEITIPLPKINLPKRLFKFLDEEVENE